MTNLTRSLVLGCSVVALAACGPTDIASPGSGGNITINNPPAAPAPSPSPSPSGPALVTPAAGCPTISDAQGLTDSGTITNPSLGTWRVCTLPAVLRTSSTLPKLAGVVYQLNGRVNVGCDGGRSVPSAGSPHITPTVGCAGASLTADTNVTLTIEPGVIVYGGTGQSWLVVNRGNRINATGNAANPIIFTSRDNILGLNTDASQGQWGGVVLLGRATTTDCSGGVAATVAAPATPNTCERQTEGATESALFGGNLDTDNSGRMSFVQIRYSGFILSGASELQALTTGATGSGTVLDHIQSVNSSDDGAEFFGGVVNLSHYIAVGADDDSLDVDTGAQMNVQYAILVQRSGRGDALFEIDSSGASENQLPRTKLQVVNFTAIAPNAVSPDNEANDQASSLFRGNSDTTLINGIISAPANECVRLNGTQVGGSAAVTLTARSVVLTCNATKFIGNGTFNATSVAAVFAGNNNSDAHVSTLTNLYINGSGESGIVATDPTPFGSFFQNRAWIGAVQNAADNWWAGWTCNTAAANFGTGNTGNCTSLPVT